VRPFILKPCQFKKNHLTIPDLVAVVVAAAFVVVVLRHTHFVARCFCLLVAVPMLVVPLAELLAGAGAGAGAGAEAVEKVAEAMFAEAADLSCLQHLE
jgi:hypothetical protein